VPTVFDATAGGPAANSYLTVLEAQDYFDNRRLGPALGDAWDSADPSQEALLIMATRIIDMYFVGHRTLVHESGESPYYITSSHWTGSPATTTQALAWPRSGMYDRNGNAISSSVIPQELKDAVAELAGQLAKEDTTLDYDVRVKGITSVKAGSVAVTFKNLIAAKVLPDAVWFLLIPSWYTDELIDPAYRAEFDVVS
jgi:hypothetical protein